jgi:uncharacterized protein DUF2630
MAHHPTRLRPMRPLAGRQDARIPMDDAQILSQVEHLVDEEHKLRRRVSNGELSSDQEQARLRAVETLLDRCWDLLRQRRARREVGSDPDEAEPRPASQVEGYLQ